MIERLQKAIDGLDPLVDRTVRGDHSEAELRDEVLRWEREDAEGNGRLSEMAISLMELQLANQGLPAEDPHTSEEVERLRALQRLRAALMLEPEDMLPREAPLDPAYQERFPQARGFRVGTAMGILTPEEHGWHISVSHPDRYPTMDELRSAAGLVQGAEAMWAMVPLQTDIGGIASNVVHLFERPPISD